jgi:peptide/nickel transport system substrate-binding protein
VSDTETWRAPDLTAAKAMIDRAGVHGTDVTVTALDFPAFRAIGQYFVDLLDELGFKATLRPMTLDELFAIPSPSTAGIQTIGLYFYGGLPSASNQTIGEFTCPGFELAPDAVGNYAAFCDPAIDARVADAFRLEGTDPVAANHAWAAIDHNIVDESPAVAAFNPTDLVFVSSRAGNVQVHPTLNLLLSQVWVQ